MHTDLSSVKRVQKGVVGGACQEACDSVTHNFLMREKELM